MSIQTSCPHCAKRFEVKEEFVGRKAKCAACKQSFVIQRCDDDPVIAFRDDAAPGGNPSAAPRSPKPAPPPPVAERRPAAKPPAGHVPSFDEVAAAAEQEAALPDFDALADAAQSERQTKPQEVPYILPTLPAPVPVKRTSGKAAMVTRKRAAGGSSVMPKIIGIYLAVVALIFLASFWYPGFAAFAGLLLILPGIASYGWGLFGFIVNPFRESIICGLACMVVPFYSLYYLVSRWEDMKRPAGRVFGGIALIVLGAFATTMPDKASSSRSGSGAVSPGGDASSVETRRPRAAVDRPTSPTPAAPSASPTRRLPESVRRQVEAPPAALTGPEAEAKLKIVEAGWKIKGPERDLFEYEREENGTLPLAKGQQYVSLNTYKPPVAFRMIIHTDLGDTRFAFGADQVILNWEMNPEQLRVDGGPASGRHKIGAGRLPRNQWTGVEWVVKPSEAILYVDGVEKYRSSADFSRVEGPFKIWRHGGETVLKDIKVVQPDP